MPAENGEENTLDIRRRSQKGSIAVIALLIMVVLTIIGLSISRTSTTEIQIAGNDLFMKQSFYIAEGGVNREAQEVGGGRW